MGIGKFIKFLALALFSVAIITFALSNRSLTSISFFPFDYEIELPLFLIFFIPLVLGIAIGGVSSVFYNLRLRYMSKSAHKQVNKLSQELEVLRTKTEYQQ